MSATPELKNIIQTLQPELEQGVKVQERAALIKATLASFGVKVEIAEVQTGPTVTQFGLSLAAKIPAKKVAEHAVDLALALAVPAVRVVLPIPGKSLVGIEVPNPKRQTVRLAELLASSEFTSIAGELKLALGLSLTGSPIVTDLARMPHLLIAGATGAGKSVFLNSLIYSLLAQYQPDSLRFIMVDPKLVELVQYNGIGHLIFPVITQLAGASSSGGGVTGEVSISNNPGSTNGKTIQLGRETDVLSALWWTVGEMERRYRHLSRHKCRDIRSYNELAIQPESQLEKLPYLVLVVDELADLMLSSASEIEPAIVRLAQKARAVGIHLVLATQRPSAEVVTGLIKANIPARAAFAVSGQVDSRVILDRTGAELLLGEGDMLFLERGAMQPVRVQGAFVNDQEINQLVARHLLPGAQAGSYDYSWLHESENQAEPKTGIGTGLENATATHSKPSGKAGARGNQSKTRTAAKALPLVVVAPPVAITVPTSTKTGTGTETGTDTGETPPATTSVLAPKPDATAKVAKASGDTDKLVSELRAQIIRLEVELAEARAKLAQERATADAVSQKAQAEASRLQQVETELVQVRKEVNQLQRQLAAVSSAHSKITPKAALSQPQPAPLTSTGLRTAFSGTEQSLFTALESKIKKLNAKERTVLAILLRQESHLTNPEQATFLSFSNLEKATGFPSLTTNFKAQLSNLLKLPIIEYKMGRGVRARIKTTTATGKLRSYASDVFPGIDPDFVLEEIVKLL